MPLHGLKHALVLTDDLEATRALLFLDDPNGVRIELNVRE